MDNIKIQIIKGLERLGVHRGDHVAVGASFKSLKGMEGGPDVFIDALLDAVGPSGTIMMNTHTKLFLPTEVRLGWTNYIFDVHKTPCITGIIAEKFRQRKGSVRSRHPVYSVTAIGKYAYFLTQEHNENSESYLPFKKLAEIKGKYLAVGIGDKLAGFRHCAQQMAGLLNVVSWERSVRYMNNSGEIQTFVLKDRGGCTRRLPELVGLLRSQGLVAEADLGRARALLVSAKEALEKMTNVLKENPEVNLCKDIFCYWCRELERELNLYKRIDNPKIFQKNRIAIYLMYLVNRIREFDNRFTAKSKILLRKVIS